MYALSMSVCMHVYAVYVCICLPRSSFQKTRACSRHAVDTVICELLWAEASEDTTVLSSQCPSVCPCCSPGLYVLCSGAGATSLWLRQLMLSLYLGQATGVLLVESFLRGCQEKENNKLSPWWWWLVWQHEHYRLQNSGCCRDVFDPELEG